MKKLLLALPLLAGSAWAGTTYYSGQQTQPAYEQLLAQLNRKFGGDSNINFVQHEYIAGFATSTAITSVMSTDAAQEKPLLKLQHIIEHSPLGLSEGAPRIGVSHIITTVLADDDMSADVQRFIEGFDNNIPGSLTTTVGFNGISKSELQVNPFSLQQPELAISMGSSRYDFETHPDGLLEGVGRFGDFSMQDNENFAVSVTGAKVDSSVRQINKWLYNGSMSISADEISRGSTLAGTVPDARASNVSISNSSDVTSQAGKLSYDISIGALESALPMNSVDANLSINGFSPESVSRLQSALSTAAQDTGNNHAGNVSPQMLMQSMLAQNLAGLLVPGVTISKALAITNDGGKADSDVQLTFVGDGTASGTDAISTTGDMLDALELDVDFSADAEALQMTSLADLLMSSPAAGYIEFDGQHYTSKVSVKDSMLLANGVQTDLREALGLLLMMPFEYLRSTN